jgi:hypothetical protein
MVLLAVPIIFLVVTGCGTLKNGRGWGEEAIWPVELKRIPDAASHALFDLQTLIPAAGAIVLGVSQADDKVTDWAINHKAWSDDRVVFCLLVLMKLVIH